MGADVLHAHLCLYAWVCCAAILFLTGYTGDNCDVPVKSSCTAGTTTCGGRVDPPSGVVTGGTCCTSDQACISPPGRTAPPQCVAKSSLFSCSGAGETPCGLEVSSSVTTSGGNSGADAVQFDNAFCCTAGQTCTPSAYGPGSSSAYVTRCT